MTSKKRKRIKNNKTKDTSISIGNRKSVPKHRTNREEPKYGKSVIGIVGDFVKDVYRWDLSDKKTPKKL